MNRDAMPDMFFYHKKSIYVYYNKLSDRSQANGSWLSGEVNLCIANNETSKEPIYADFRDIHPDDVRAGGAQDLTIQDLSSQLAAGDGAEALEIIDVASHLDPTGHYNSVDNNKQFQGRLRYGDINIDGYPDLYITLILQDTTTKKQYSKSMVLINTPCSTGFCSKKSMYSDKYIEE